MAIELIRFIGGALILLIPGVFLARFFGLGESLLERWATGCSLGLAMAVYVASAISHLDLRGFYPVWGIIALCCVFAWARSKNSNRTAGDSAINIWMWLILLVVGFSRFAAALPLVLPSGQLDPTFHLVLAKQIQITHHAIDRWPFADIPLNYPTGSHVLLVVLSALTGLPLHTVFKDLIPLLGVLTTAQMYVFARHMTGSALHATYSAGIYGLWAWYGSIDYFRWGGLPNELAMLLFLAMLSVGGESRRRLAAMAILFAGVVLVHHHVMVVATAIFVLVIVWRMAKHQTWRPLAIAMVAGLVMDGFFLVPYAMHLANFRSTGMVSIGEPVLEFKAIPGEFGYAIFAVAIVGVAVRVIGKFSCNAIVAIASASLAVMFIVGEYVFPLALKAMHRDAITFFTPSRFLTDLDYFLPIYAAGALLYFQRYFRFPVWIAMLIVLIAPVADYENWIGLFTAYQPPPELIDACDWIQQHTPTDTIVDNQTAWLTYLCWREPAQIALPISEPIAEYHPASERIPLIIAGKLKPDSEDMMIVKIGDAREFKPGRILWRDSAGAAVSREWP